MTDALTKAAQAALDALDNAIDHLPKPYSTGCSNAATDLRAALAAQQAPDLIPQDALFSCPQMGNSVTRVTQQAAQPVSCQAPLDTSQAAQSVALPDLPTHWTKVTDPDGVEVKVWRAFQMRDFARAAIAAAQPQQATDKIGGAA